MQEKENSTPPPRKGLFRNWLSLVGVLIPAGSVFSCLFLFATELFLPTSNPYMGILVYILAPVFFFLGVALMIAGLWMQRRQKPGSLVNGGQSVPSARPEIAGRVHRRGAGVSPVLRHRKLSNLTNTPTRSSFAARPVMCP